MVFEQNSPIVIIQRMMRGHHCRLFMKLKNQKMHQKIGVNIITSAIKRTTKNFVRAITRLQVHPGPRGVYFTLEDYPGENCDTLKRKLQTDLKSCISNRT